MAMLPSPYDGNSLSGLIVSELAKRGVVAPKMNQQTEDVDPHIKIWADSIADAFIQHLVSKLDGLTVMVYGNAHEHTHQIAVSGVLTDGTPITGSKLEA